MMQEVRLTQSIPSIGADLEATMGDFPTVLHEKVQVSVFWMRGQENKGRTRLYGKGTYKSLLSSFLGSLVLIIRKKQSSDAKSLTIIFM